MSPRNAMRRLSIDGKIYVYRKVDDYGWCRGIKVPGETDQYLREFCTTYLKDNKKSPLRVYCESRDFIHLEDALEITCDGPERPARCIRFGLAKGWKPETDTRPFYLRIEPSMIDEFNEISPPRKN